MKPAIFILLALLCRTPGRSQVVYNYEFNNSLHASNGGPDLKATCTPVFAQQTFFKPQSITHSICKISKGCGLSFTDSADLLKSGVYTIEMYISLDNPRSYNKLIDYKDLTDDNGLYDANTACNFRGPGNVSGEYFTGQGYYFVCITRASNKDVKMYVDGQLVDGVNDAEKGYAIYGDSKTIYFLQDDTYSSGAESCNSTIALLRIYNVALDEHVIVSHFAGLKSALSPKPAKK